MNRTLAVGLLFIVLGACRETAAPVPAPTTPPPDTSVRGTLRVLTIPTADGTGRVVHPDYVRMPASWPGSPRYLAITTYPAADPTREWPSLFSQDSACTHWHLPAGGPNPVLQPPTAMTYTDPDVVYVPDSNQIWMYVRLVTPMWNVLQLIRSGDGVNWTSPVDIDSAVNHGMISPAVVRRGTGDWYLWSVHAGAGGCAVAGSAFLQRRTSTDGVHWSVPDTARIAGHPWHVDVQWIPDRKEWWALYVESCLPTAVRLATSPDGLAWSVLPSPVITAGVISQVGDVVYRSTFAVEGDSVRFWFSGARWDSVSDSGWVWRAAASIEGTSALLERLSQPAPVAPRRFVAPRGQLVPYPEAP